MFPPIKVENPWFRKQLKFAFFIERFRNWLSSVRGRPTLFPFQKIITFSKRSHWTFYQTLIIDWRRVLLRVCVRKITSSQNWQTFARWFFPPFLLYDTSVLFRKPRIYCTVITTVINKVVCTRRFRNCWLFSGFSVKFFGLNVFCFITPYSALWCIILFFTISFVQLD